MRRSSAGDGAEVGHETENALGLLALKRNGLAVGVEGVLPWGWFLLLGGVWRGRGGLLGGVGRIGGHEEIGRRRRLVAGELITGSGASGQLDRLGTAACGSPRQTKATM